MSAAPQSIAASRATRDFLARRHLLLIGGRWVESADHDEFPVHDPATEMLLTKVACGGVKDIDRAVAAARAAFNGEWSRLNSHQRSRLIWRLADELEANLDLAVELEVLDNGIPFLRRKMQQHGL